MDFASNGFRISKQHCSKRHESQIVAQQLSPAPHPDYSVIMNWFRYALVLEGLPATLRIHMNHKTLLI